MAVRYRIDYSELRQAVNNFNSVQEIDIKKEVNWYLNQVYRDLSRRHGKSYSYITPPGNERTNLRVRSRRLLNDLKASRFVSSTSNSVTAGWDIPEGNPKGKYLGIHTATGYDDLPYHLTPAKAKYTYTTKKGQKRILIPLRAGMNSDGTPKPITGRNRDKIKVMPFEATARAAGFDWSGENKRKFRAKTIVLYKIQGRKKIPMYIIVKQARIPRRLLLGPTMDKYKEQFYQRLENQIDKALDRVSKRRNR